MPNYLFYIYFYGISSSVSRPPSSFPLDKGLVAGFNAHAVQSGLGTATYSTFALSGGEGP